jgi:predicted methyltransferase
MRTQPLYITRYGRAVVGDAFALLGELDDESMDLVMTSPPFALRRQKSYGNVEETDYVAWIVPFGREVFRVLKKTGSFVLDPIAIALQLQSPIGVLRRHRLSFGRGFLLVQPCEAAIAH